jgi:hypothetical protein
MKFTKNADANGTYLQGYLSATFDELVAVFGESQGSGDKNTQEWSLRFEDGTVATIYDWKEYQTPVYTYDWHVGGASPQALVRVQQAFSQNRTRKSKRVIA